MTDIQANRVLHGDCLEQLQELPESSVHMCMTSPPYYRLRDYGEDGQIGLEDTLDEYIHELVEVGRKLRRVLRDDGSWWLNLGDSYETDGTDKFDPKQKHLAPHRVAIALQEDGWVVRNDVTWVKPNPMPSSVKDRLNTTTEQVFHLTPEPDYWYDLDAIREEYSDWSRKALKGNWTRNESYGESQSSVQGLAKEGKNYAESVHPAGKNPGDVLVVTTKPYPEAHFAVYPPELCEKPIKATCPPKVCADCGAPYEREVERKTSGVDETRPSRNLPEGQQDQKRRCGDTVAVETEGWTPTCSCDTDETRAGIALDPFAGAGTTLKVAKDFGRRFLGIELNEEFVALAEKRAGITVTNPEYLRDDEGQKGIESFKDSQEGDA